MAETPCNITKSQASQVSQQITPQMQQLQTAFQQANTAVKNGHAKRDVAQEQDSCSDSCLTGMTDLLVSEITGTVNGAIAVLGLGQSS
jgi:hypothetical protein